MMKKTLAVIVTAIAFCFSTPDAFAQTYHQEDAAQDVFRGVGEPEMNAIGIDWVEIDVPNSGPIEFKQHHNNITPTNFGLNSEFHCGDRAELYIDTEGTNAGPEYKFYQRCNTRRLYTSTGWGKGGDAVANCANEDVVTNFNTDNVVWTIPNGCLSGSRLRIASDIEIDRTWASWDDPWIAGSGDANLLTWDLFVCLPDDSPGDFVGGCDKDYEDHIFAPWVDQ